MIILQEKYKKFDFSKKSRKNYASSYSWYSGAYYPISLHNEFFNLFGESLLFVDRSELYKYLDQDFVDLNKLKALILIWEKNDWNFVINKNFSNEAKRFYSSFLKIFYHLNDPNFNSFSFPDEYSGIVAYVTGKFLKARLFPELYSLSSGKMHSYTRSRYSKLVDF